MVLAGQYLERSVVIESGGAQLDGLYHRGAARPACVIAPPHPALGGSMSAPVVAELAWALTRQGHPTLRFDYRGVGASTGSLCAHDFAEGARAALDRSEGGADLPSGCADLLSGGADLLSGGGAPPFLAGCAQHLGAAQPLDAFGAERHDLLAAAAQLCATTASDQVCAVGYSLGAAAALLAAGDPRIGRLVLVAPPTKKIDFGAIAKLGKPLLVVAAQHDAACDRAELQRLLAPLGELGRLAIVPHADAVFRRGLQEMAREVAAWLAPPEATGGRARTARSGEIAEKAAASGAKLIELEEGEALELDE